MLYDFSLAYIGCINPFSEVNLTGRNVFFSNLGQDGSETLIIIFHLKCFSGSLQSLSARQAVTKISDAAGLYTTAT